MGGIFSSFDYLLAHSRLYYNNEGKNYLRPAIQARIYTFHLYLFFPFSVLVLVSS